jgi:PKD repeat protein
MMLENAAPVANAGSDRTADEGETLTFTGSFTDAGMLDTHEFLWDFGDGNTSTELAPTHIYADEGVYTVSLTVTDDDGDSDMDTIRVTALNIAPTIDSLTGDTAVDKGQQASFTASARDPGDDELTYTWDFGDGSDPVSGVDLANVNHTYTQSAGFAVTLTVTDGDGGIDEESLIVIVSDGGPTAVVTGDTILDEGHAGSFDASGSSSHPNAIVSYEWDWNYDGLVFTASGDTAAIQSHMWTDNGTYNVAVRVTDDIGSTDIATLTVTVNDLAPTAAIVGDVVLDEGQSGSFDASGSASSPNAIVAYEWDWNYDGVTFNPSGDVGVTQSHAWAEDGSYAVAVRVTDDDGSTDTETLVVTVVDAQAPVVTVDALLTNDSTPSLSGTADDPEARIIVTVNGSEYRAANYGDGTWMLADDVISPALSDGIYDLAVTATDAAGKTGTDGTIDELTIDTVAPVVTVDTLVTNDATPQLTGTVDDAAAVVEVTVAGTAYVATNNGDGTWTLADDTISPALADGTCDVSVSAADLAGNVGTDTTTNLTSAVRRQNPQFCFKNEESFHYNWLIFFSAIGRCDGKCSPR